MADNDLRMHLRILHVQAWGRRGCRVVVEFGDGVVYTQNYPHVERVDALIRLQELGYDLSVLE
jgi:hypothetical protein